MRIETAIASLSSFATTGWQLLNSNFAIAFVGGFAGAIGGALGAQRIVEDSRKREERLKELRYTNAAIMVAHSICNAALALKKQHIQPMREKFIQSKADVEEFSRKRAANLIAPNAAFPTHLDMRTFPAPVVPIDTLKHILFQEISAVGRPLALASVIEQSLIGLNGAIAKRDQLIQKFASGDIPEKNHAQFYFGLPLQGGHLNQEYPDLVEAIYSYIDDLAFFSHQLCIDLMKHGAKVRDVLLAKKSSRQVPHVSEVDFSAPLKTGLMPPESQYRDWVNAFVEKTE